MDYILYSYILLTPLIISGILHMIVVKANILSFLKIPIHKKAFGANKTIRGLVLMPVFSIPGMYVAAYFDSLLKNPMNLSNPNNSMIIAGLLLGLSYILAELPNSFIKRRFDIKEGDTGSNWRIFQVIMDQADSGFGIVFVLYFYLDLSILICIMFLLTGTITHLFINWLLYILKVRKRPI